MTNINYEGFFCDKLKKINKVKRIYHNRPVPFMCLGLEQKYICTNYKGSLIMHKGRRRKCNRIEKGCHFLNNHIDSIFLADTRAIYINVIMMFLCSRLNCSNYKNTNIMKCIMFLKHIVQWVKG